MDNKRQNASGALVLSLLLTAAPVVADDAAPTSGFHYTDDWAVVSAPPPPGPYRAVNIDPRVPGVDAIPPISMDAVSPHGAEDIPAEALNEAPAAGIPADRLPQQSPAAALATPQAASPRPQPVNPANMGRSPSPTTGYNYPAPQYQSQPRTAQPPGYTPAYPGYGNQPAYGYYGTPAYPQGQQQVPPPPVYDSANRSRYPYGRPAGQGTP
jgi:hypothetical protein